MVVEVFKITVLAYMVKAIDIDVSYEIKAVPDRLEQIDMEKLCACVCVFVCTQNSAFKTYRSFMYAKFD